MEPACAESLFHQIVYLPSSLHRTQSTIPSSAAIQWVHCFTYSPGLPGASVGTKDKKLRPLAPELCSLLTNKSLSIDPDSSWSEWTDWSGCSTSCGKGIRNRERHCLSTVPGHDGRGCGSTDPKEFEPCKITDCQSGQSHEDEGSEGCGLSSILTSMIMELWYD